MIVRRRQLTIIGYYDIKHSFCGIAVIEFLDNAIKAQYSSIDENKFIDRDLLIGPDICQLSITTKDAGPKKIVGELNRRDITRDLPEELKNFLEDFNENFPSFSGLGALFNIHADE